MKEFELLWPTSPTTLELLRRSFPTAVANAGISGSDVRDMMLEAVENRFRATRAPQAIEHLSENGSAYTARDTGLFAQALNLTPCFTPVASPQSNGMSEAFVKTLKRDYICKSAMCAESPCQPSRSTYESEPIFMLKHNRAVTDRIDLTAAGAADAQNLHASRGFLHLPS